MFQVGSDKETIGCVEECVIAAEELQTLGGLVRTDIRAVSDSVAAINEQIEQLESLFRNIDRLEEFVKQVLSSRFQSWNSTASYQMIIIKYRRNVKAKVQFLFHSMIMTAKEKKILKLYLNHH